MRFNVISLIFNNMWKIYKKRIKRKLKSFLEKKTLIKILSCFIFTLIVRSLVLPCYTDFSFKNWIISDLKFLFSISSVFLGFEIIKVTIWDSFNIFLNPRKLSTIIYDNLFNNRLVLYMWGSHGESYNDNLPRHMLTKTEVNNFINNCNNIPDDRFVQNRGTDFYKNFSYTDFVRLKKDMRGYIKHDPHVKIFSLPGNKISIIKSDLSVLRVFRPNSPEFNDIASSKHGLSYLYAMYNLYNSFREGIKLEVSAACELKKCVNNYRNFIPIREEVYTFYGHNLPWEVRKQVATFLELEVQEVCSLNLSQLKHRINDRVSFLVQKVNESTIIKDLYIKALKERSGDDFYNRKKLRFFETFQDKHKGIKNLPSHYNIKWSDLYKNHIIDTNRLVK